MNLNNPDHFESGSSNELLNIDVKRIFYQAIRYWYLIAITLLICVSIAFLVNRYSTRIYEIKASIIVKESEEVSGGGELIYNNPLARFYRNYLNELYIIQANPLFEQTIQELGYEKIYFRIGDLKTSEVYHGSPVSVDILRPTMTGQFAFQFSLKNDSIVEITVPTEDSELNFTAALGDTVKIDSALIFLSSSGHRSVEGEEYEFRYRKASGLVPAYQGRLKADWAEEGSGVINLSITGPISEKEVDFLEALIQNYQEFDLDKKNTAASNAIKFINDQLSTISDSLNFAERQLQAFKNKNIVTDLNSEATRLYQKMEGLDVQKTELVIRESYYNYLTDYINKSPDLEQVILPSSVGIEDAILTKLVSEMIALQTDVKLMSRPGKLENPMISARNRRIKELKTDVLESVRNQRAVDKIRLDFLSKGIREIEKQLSYLPVAERQLVKIRRNYSLLENLYTYLLQKRAETGITKASNISDIVVVNPPTETSIISPKRTINYILGVAFGIVLPFGVFILMELFNTRIQSREDIEKITTIPFIGGMGHNPNARNVEVMEKPKSAIAESFRALRSNLNFFQQGRDKGVYLITSSISGEGKTFTSINLASVFALSGKKVLIIGADMRRPKIFNDFSLTNDLGLSNYLAGLNSFESVIQQTQFAQLDLVSGGPVPPNPSELIMSRQMDEFLKIAKEKYDYIIIDSPPLALVTDAFVLASKVDHTLFIVRQNYTPKNLLRTINEFATSGRIQSISIVLNDIYKSGPGYGYGYGYYYGYGYGYGRKQQGGYYE